MLFSLTTEPDPRLHRPFHIGIFLPSWAKQVVFLENIPVERAVLPSKIDDKLKLEPGCWNLQTVIANCQLYSALNLKDQSK